jgi:hypothetical protein
MSDTRRINANFSERTYRALEELAHDQGKTKAEVLRDAIELEEWFQRARRDGERVLVERDGTTREIILR